MHLFRPSTFLFLSSLTLGCGADSAEPFPSDEATPRGSGGCRGCVWGPPVLNTNQVNGLSLPELDLSGRIHNGVVFLWAEIGTDPNRERLVSVEAVEGIFKGVGESGTFYSGADFVGASFHIEDHRLGSPLATEMRISSFTDDGPRTRYGVVHSGINPGEGFVPTCALDNETGDHSAVMFQDLHVESDGTISPRPDTLYFGCTSGAVGKAATWGYAPWIIGDDGHLAAVRSVRADYCGDGSSWTEAGTPLQITDPLVINRFPDSTLPTEAIWSQYGAECVMQPRLSQWNYDDVMIQCTDRFIPMCEEEWGLDDVPNGILWTKIWQ